MFDSFFTKKIILVAINEGVKNVRVFILTKNVLCEQQLQNQLQRLDHEVFVSNYLFDEPQAQFLFVKLIDYFQIILISETVTDAELLRILPALNQQKKVVFRKNEYRPDKADQEYWTNKGIKGWISCDSKIESVREQLSKMIENEFSEQKNMIVKEKRGLTMLQLRQAPIQKMKEVKLSDCKFANNEKRLLGVLINKKDELCSREEICKILWDSEPTNSKLAQLSSLIKKMKKRFRNLEIYEEMIETKWGKGYMLTDNFYEYFIGNDPSEQIKEGIY